MKKGYPYNCLLLSFVVICLLGACSLNTKLADDDFNKTMIKSFPDREIVHHDQIELQSIEELDKYIFYFDIGDKIEVPVKASGGILQVEQTIKLRVAKKVYIIMPDRPNIGCEKRIQGIKSGKEWLEVARLCTPYFSVDQNHWIPFYAIQKSLDLVLGKNLNFEANLSADVGGLSLKLEIADTKKQ